MIVFYNKKTGKIKGTIDGRVHSDAHLEMWIGDKEKIGRLVLDWENREVGEEEVEEEQMIRAGVTDEQGNSLFKIKKVKKKVPVKEWCPKKQPRVVKKIDSGKVNIRDYKVDVKNKRLIKKS